MENLDSPRAVVMDTVGCKLNQAETEALARQFYQAGYQLVALSDSPDIYVLNTCTVTHVADSKSRRLLRSARMRNPNALIVATGCYAQRAAEEVGRIQGVDLIIGNEDKHRLVEMVEAAIHRSLKSRPRVLISQPTFRTRALVKIQDGCNQCCAYCIVPRTRGREQSLPMGQIIEEVKARVDQGYKEIILTGTQIGAYGQGKEENLEKLVGRLLAETKVERLRLSSLQPQDLTPALLKLWKDGRLCGHLHLPLQSGSDAVLQQMKRRYSTAQYEEAVARARQAVPGLAITTDVIVGFPGESNEEFEESYQFCQRIGFARLHIFPYSARPGTLAAQMANKVKEQVKKERSQRMLRLAQRSIQRFQEQFLGDTMMVLWERRNVEGSKEVWDGLTDNYLRVFVTSEEPLTNRLVPAKLLSINRRGIWGELK